MYTALGSEVTFIEAMDNIMPTFDREIAKMAERLLIRDRPIDYRTSVFASEVTPGIPGVKPVTIKMIDAKTKEHVETLEVDACMVATGRVPNTKNMGLESRGITANRGFVAVNEKMQVLASHDENADVIPNVYCIGDANGKMMLAHAASAQGISAVENIVGRVHAVNHEAMYVLFCHWKEQWYTVKTHLSHLFSLLARPRALLILKSPWSDRRKNNASKRP